MMTSTEASLLTFGTPPALDQAATLSIGSLVFSDQDQIDFTGPFEVLSRLSDARFHVIGLTLDPVTDVKGLTLTPTMIIDDVVDLDVLVVPGGLGQQAIMDDRRVLELIRRHDDRGALIFSVCTGALLCGAAGLLVGRHATTHWAAKELLPLYGAIPADARVVVDGRLVSAAGVTAGLDGALQIAAMLRGKEAAEEIQLEIEYAPNPVFHSGTPESAAPSVVEAYYKQYGHHRSDRRQAAEVFARAHSFDA